MKHGCLYAHYWHAVIRLNVTKSLILGALPSLNRV